MLTCYNNNLPFDPRSVGIWGNLFQDGDVLEFPLFPNWRYELLTERCQSALCRRSHDGAFTGGTVENRNDL
jgi:hypothetical protein